ESENRRSRKSRFVFKEHMSMRKILTLIVVAIVGSLTVLSGSAIAQTGNQFDGAKFWREFETRNVSFPANFDGQKFLDELATRNVANKEQFDGKKFFEELEARGVKF